MNDKDRGAFALGFITALAGFLAGTMIVSVTAPTCRPLQTQVILFGNHAVAVPDGTTVTWCKSARLLRFVDARPAQSDDQPEGGR